MTLALEQRIADLEAEVAHWKGEAQRNAKVDAADRIRRALGLTPAEAWIVAQLHAARGAVVRNERLDEDLPGRNWEERAEGNNVIQVMMCRIRSKIGRPDCIETVRCHGYRMSDALVARIDGFLS